MTYHDPASIKRRRTLLVLLAGTYTFLIVALFFTYEFGGANACLEAGGTWLGCTVVRHPGVLILLGAITATYGLAVMTILRKWSAVDAYLNSQRTDG
jgi:hypothetical protein